MKLPSVSLPMRPMKAVLAPNRDAVQIAVGRLQSLLAKATETLDRSLTCGSPSVETRAALAVIDQAFKGAELLDLGERLAALEKKAAEDTAPL